mmetsp:Transcript_25293/g.37181  ORF Transcript_25293/g.37181 Transcript_25293/m.37181 type:complete len:216 (-) Transcript_25293:682-1329(-)
MAWIGYLPLAVSPESITQSVPSKTALATSEVSARVGRGLLIIDSSICVAVTTGLPAMLHLEIIIFCASVTFSPGISTPMSPRATMTPSVTARISSKFSRPSWFSILEMILIFLPPLSSRCLRIPMTSEAFLMKEAATKSTPCWQPKVRSSLSFSVRAGRVIFTPGRFTPFLPPRSPELFTLHLTSSPFFSMTVNEIRPSSTRIVPPMSIERARSL